MPTHWMILNRSIISLAFLGLSPAHTPGQPVIRAGTRLMQINVIARDQHGTVGDLTKADFTLTGKGKAREIAVFQMRSRKLDDERLRAAPKLPPNVFSNAQIAAAAPR